MSGVLNSLSWSNSTSSSYTQYDYSTMTYEYKNNNSFTQNCILVLGLSCWTNEISSATISVDCKAYKDNQLFSSLNGSASQIYGYTYRFGTSLSGYIGCTLNPGETIKFVIRAGYNSGTIALIGA